MSIYTPGRAVTSAIGQEMAELAGVLLTRLTADLPPAGWGVPPAEALVAELETTVHFDPDGGEIAINGERIPYEGVSGATLTGLTRDPRVTTTYRRGDLVAFLGTYSSIAAARDQLFVDTAEGDYLAIVGRNLGVPRFFDVPDDVYRAVIKVIAYMPGKGSRTTIEAFLEALLTDEGKTLTVDARTGPDRLEGVPGDFAPGMVRLPVRVVTPTRSRYTRIESVSFDGSVAYLSQINAPYWQAADLDDEDAVTATVLPFEVVEPAHRSNTVWIDVRHRPPDDPAGYAYLNPGETVSPAGVDEVTVAHDIRQVLGVWLATDVNRSGTNYATTNTFAGNVITLDTPLPAGPPDVVVDYGWIYAGEDPAPVPGDPGTALGRATAEILADADVPNPEDVIVDGVVLYSLVRYPLYLGGRLSLLLQYLDALTVAGVIPELTVTAWE